MAHMEEVLDLYEEPYDPRRPVVCFDETSTQLLAQTRPALPPRPGIPLRQDYEYRREGTRNLFLTCEPQAGWRHVAVTQRRTMEDFAQQMRWLVDEAYPETPVVRVVLDNLNTHRMASLYEAFPAAEARRIAKRLEFHYTPKHGSWLNMAEIEFSVLSRSCLRQRLPDEEALGREVQALVTERNTAQATINWRFNTHDARTKLHRLYPFDSKHDWLLDSAFYLCKAVLPGMMARRSGSIIALGGQSSVTGRPDTAAVTAAKTGLLGLIRAIAAEMAPHNVRANMVNPGSTDTSREHPEWYPEFQGTVDRSSSSHLRSLPMGRQATVADIANACLFFASDESAYITGDRLNVMGGRYIV